MISLIPAFYRFVAGEQGSGQMGVTSIDIIIKVNSVIPGIDENGAVQDVHRERFFKRDHRAFSRINQGVNTFFRPSQVVVLKDMQGQVTRPADSDTAVAE